MRAGLCHGCPAQAATTFVLAMMATPKQAQAGSRCSGWPLTTIARGSAMECAAHLDVMKLDELLESEAASTCSSASWPMLTKLIDP
jgi:hypothetical protein